jgi:hypothetical protein
MAVTKIATCCYCGTRAALVLRGAERHELSCSSCGAPLHALKMLPIPPSQVSHAPAQPARNRAHGTPSRAPRATVQKPQKRRKSKGFGRKMFEEIWDVIEDVFD